MIFSKFIVFITLFGVIPTGFAASQSSAEQCVNIKNNQKRLACYDSLNTNIPQNKKKASVVLFIQNIVREKLTDPNSAIFGKLYKLGDDESFCILVNSRNQMGGYTGNKSLQVSKGEDGWIVYQTNSANACDVDYSQASLY